MRIASGSAHSSFKKNVMVNNYSGTTHILAVLLACQDTGSPTILSPVFLKATQLFLAAGD